MVTEEQAKRYAKVIGRRGKPGPVIRCPDQETAKRLASGYGKVQKETSRWGPHIHSARGGHGATHYYYSVGAFLFMLTPASDVVDAADAGITAADKVIVDYFNDTRRSFREGMGNRPDHLPKECLEVCYPDREHKTTEERRAEAEIEKWLGWAENEFAEADKYMAWARYDMSIRDRKNGIYNLEQYEKHMKNALYNLTQAEDAIFSN